MAAEKQLISLDEALEATHKEVYWTKSEAAYIRSFLVKLPKVDAVEVVRCKDCKWVYRDKYSGVYFCHERQVRSEHFCSYGERRTDE